MHFASHKTLPAANNEFNQWTSQTNTQNQRSEDIYLVEEAVSRRNDFADAVIPQNPYLGKNNFGSPHCDSYCSESVGLTGPVSGKLRVIRQRNPHGYTPCMVCNQNNQMISVSLDVKEHRFWLVVYDKNCNLISSTKLSLKPPNLTFGGGYFYMNHADQTIAVQENKMICFNTSHVTADSGSGDTNALTPLWETQNLVKLITQSPSDNAVYSSMPVWNGDGNLYWVLLAGVFDPPTMEITQPAGMAVVRVTPNSTSSGGCDTKIVDKILFKDLWNNNTFSVDEVGAYFVTNGIDDNGGMTSGFLHHLQFINGKIVDCWATPYKNCGYRKMGQTNVGSGTTPTLTETKDGKKLVAITDNDAPRVNVLVCDRVTGEQISETPVFALMRSGDEASLIGVEDNLIVENNYGHVLTVPMSQYTPIEPGMTRIHVDATNKSANEMWTDDRTSFLAMNMLARKSGIIFAHTADWSDSVSATEGPMYFITAMDAFTGRKIWRVPLGRGVEFCHDYGGLYFNSDESLFIGTQNYIISVQDCN